MGEGCRRTYMGEGKIFAFSQNQPHITPDYAYMVIITKNTTFCTLAQTDTLNIT